MLDLVLISDKEMKRLKDANYEVLLDWQYNLMQDIVDYANTIIHREYKNENILQDGIYMVRTMVLYNMVLRTVLLRFKGSQMAEEICQQYSNEDCKLVSDLITDKIDELKHDFDVLKQALSLEDEDDDRYTKGVETVIRLANINLDEYEDTLSRIYSQPEKV